MLGSSGITLETVTNLVTTAIANLPTTFVSPTSMTVAELYTNYPPSATYIGKYARVTDLYNNGVAGQGIDEVMRCRYNATNGEYKWQPQRENFNAAVASTGGNLTITPLVTPPTLRLTGGLLSSLTINMSSTNAYVGQKQRIIQNSSNLGVLVTTLTGLIGSNLTLLAGTTTDVEFGPTGWFKSM